MDSIATNDDLAVNHKSSTPNRPIPSTEHINPTPNTQVVPSSIPNQPIPSTEHAPAPQLLNPTASTFTPN